MKKSALHIAVLVLGWALSAAAYPPAEWFRERFELPPLVFDVANARPVRGGVEFPRWPNTVEISNGALDQRLKIPIVARSQFSSLPRQYKDRGFWYLFSPSSKDSHLTGHGQILIGETVHTRSGEHGIRDLQSIDLAQVLSDTFFGNPHSYLVAQFFELSPRATAFVEKFFRERVYFRYYSPDPLYSLPFGFFPHSTSRRPDDGYGHITDPAKVVTENCNTFCFSFYYPRWQQGRPDIGQSGLLTEMGGLQVAQSPAMQVFLNHASPAHRQTLMITADGKVQSRDLHQLHAASEYGACPPALEAHAVPWRPENPWMGIR